MKNELGGVGLSMTKAVQVEVKSGRVEVSFVGYVGVYSDENGSG
jgi:hypothetical protein